MFTVTQNTTEPVDNEGGRKGCHSMPKQPPILNYNLKEMLQAHDISQMTHIYCNIIVGEKQNPIRDTVLILEDKPLVTFNCALLCIWVFSL